MAQMQRHGCNMFVGTRHGNNSGGFRASAITFTGEYYERNLSLFSSNGKLFLFSFWIRPTNIAASDTWLFDSGRVGIFLDSSDGLIYASFLTIAGTIAYSMRSLPGEALVDDQWYHVMGSVDTADTSKCFLYINKVSSKFTIGSSLALDIDLTGLPAGIMALFASTAYDVNPGFDMAELYITDSWLDLSLAENQAKFVRGRSPAYLGQDGAAVTGSVPKLYLAGRASDFGTNKGNGGALTPSAGAITDSVNEPIRF